MSKQEEFREKLIQYQLLDSRIKALTNKRDLLLRKIFEIETTLFSVEEIEKSGGKRFLFSVGSDVNIPGLLEKSKKLVVNLGANVAIEKSIEETKKILEKRKSLLNNALKSIENELISLNEELRRLEPEIRSLLEKVTKKKS